MKNIINNSQQQKENCVFNIIGSILSSSILLFSTYLYSSFDGDQVEKYTPKEVKCLVDTVYAEARGEPITGKIAVAQVILNRTEDAKFSSNICGVVSNGFAKEPKHVNFEEWKSVELTMLILLNNYEAIPDLTEGATYFHANYVKPYWSKKFKKTVVINNHIFYKS